MADQHSLMKPLRSDSLRPRPSTQAVWPLPEKTETVLQPPPEPQPLEAAHVEESLPEPERESAAPLSPERAVQAEEPFVSILCDEPEQPDNDDDAEYAGPDAVPSAAMPEPVCVPLYDDAPPRKKRRGWLWLVLMMLIAGAGYAAWHFGLLDCVISAILP